jgi:hypothetical protein
MLCSCENPFSKVLPRRDRLGRGAAGIGGIVSTSTIRRHPYSMFLYSEDVKIK